MFPELQNQSTQTVIFYIENQIDYRPRISFLEDENSPNHINLKDNLTLSIYLGNFSAEGFYISLNISFSANFSVINILYFNF